MFGYSAYNLILHWNHYLCSQPLTDNSFAIDRLEKLPVSCALDLIPYSLLTEETRNNLFHHGVTPKVLVNPQSKGIASA
jgi:hypothetical protein